MRSRHLLAAIAAAAALSIATDTARAQSAAASPTPAAAATTPSHWDAHPTGKFDLSVTTPGGIVEARLTLADSAGTTTATLWPVGDRDAHVMTLTNKGTELVMVTDTPHGTLEIVLERRGDVLTGRWTRGDESGTLEGKPSRS